MISTFTSDSGILLMNSLDCCICILILIKLCRKRKKEKKDLEYFYTCLFNVFYIIIIYK